MAFIEMLKTVVEGHEYGRGDSQCQNCARSLLYAYPGSVSCADLAKDCGLDNGGVKVSPTGKKTASDNLKKLVYATKARIINKATAQLGAPNAVDIAFKRDQGEPYYFLIINAPIKISPQMKQGVTEAINEIELLIQSLRQAVQKLKKALI